MKRLSTLLLSVCLLAGSFVSALHAMDAEVFYTIQTGVRGEGDRAVYTPAQFGWLSHGKGKDFRLYTGTPTFSRTDLTQYAIVSGDDGKAKKVTFQYTPTSEYPYFYMYYCSEVHFGEGGHAPFYMEINVHSGDTVLGCPIHISWDLLTVAQSMGYVLTHKSCGTGAHDDIVCDYEGHIPWQVQTFDLTEYVGRTITIEVEATCCSNVRCKSNWMVAFEKERSLLGGCDAWLKAPTYSEHSWYKGAVENPEFSTDEKINITEDPDDYFCVIKGSCPDTLHFVVTDTCPCLKPIVQDIDTAINQENLPYTWHGHLFTGPETYSDTLQNIWGCDSVIYNYSLLACLTVYADTCSVPNIYWVRPGSTVTVNANPDGDYRFTHWDDGNTENPRVFTVMGNLTDTAYFTYNRVTLTIYSEGCDTPNVYRNIEAGSVVLVNPVPQEGQYFDGWSDGNKDNPRYIQVDTDSTITVLWRDDQCPDNLTGDTTATACDAFTWHGTTYTESTDEPTWTTTNAAGCDSIVTLHLTIHKSGAGEETQTICDKQLPYTWKDKTCDHAGDYTFDTLTVHGCDSVITLHLYVDTYTTGDTTAVACDAFTWHGTTYTESTDTATWTTTNVAGCDSVVTLHLTIYKSGTGEETQTICDKQLPYTWKDKICDRAGDYTFDTLTVHGCDSVITLHLIVKDHAEHDTTAYICYQDLPFIWHGKEAKDGDTIVRTNVAGCDSIVTLHLTISAAPKTMTIDTVVCDTLMPFTWRGYTYTQPDSYRETLYNKQGCDSVYCVYRLDTVHCARPLPPDPPEPECVDSLVYRKWADVLFCDNGKHEFVSYQWYRDAVKMQGETKQYLYIKGGMGSSTYYVIATRADGSVVETCPLTFYERTASASTYGTIVAIPGRYGWLRVTIPDDEGQMTVWDVLGRLIKEERIYKQTEISLPDGVYLFHLKGETGESVYKILTK